MISMLIIPAIDLRAGRCVRLSQGRKDATTIYEKDPVDVAEDFERAGARMLHIVDLDGAFSESNSRNREVMRDITRAVKIPVQFGGGLRSMRDVEQAIGVGVARVVIGTLAVESPEKLARMVHLFGVRDIVVGIDARNGQVVTHGWETQTPVSSVTLARRVAELGIERIVYTDVQRDGTLAGVNLEQTRTLALESGLKVTASGGVSSLDDLTRLKALTEWGVDSVIIGKAFYEGRFTLQEALNTSAISTLSGGRL